MDKITRNIREGIHILLPFYENLPDISLSLGKSPLPSLEYGTNYFLQLSRVNDLNRLPTDMLSLFTHDIMLPETDMEKVYDILNIKSVKSYGKSIKADAVVADLSARNRLFKKDRELIKSNNYLTDNNLYISDYKMLTFEVFRPLFDLSSEKYCIVKLPTLFGKCVIDTIRVYCSLFKSVRLFKCASDSWLKDSAIMVASDIYKKNIDIFMSHIRSVLKSQYWKDSNNVQFSILKESVDKEFINKFLEFSTSVYESLYYVHSLLYSSMISDNKSIENEYQKKLTKLLL
ncbi:SPV086 mRNA capping enzyme small subunit [Swinepox virus]|uniref:mRNA-capping enzyme small subunit n=2 Tax=Swinepox virus TaxID=10276 RepID=MCES_SWPVK|nr:SPV086 mRNA capping enzyme small subunit [Swinepox virus]Q08512.1 RecName: Full=mRNA-capping enzyme small subunit; AltName: Full=mRNA (guanine-N(7))-methyltransferase; AltName: Full=mRNA cap methyltransferase [Swinepox virus (STRAIN KASZA)]AAA16177.1 ORF H2L [Swinepox virus]AAL69825.1 SPV086 mRNA capping enzyme small subunit [Swinepox virus]UED36601.1 SPV086 mRNA capping enzyme small subunit [Swinepox virus]UED36750.1 SPV086 mRNA capping enzyme small subunit [Swinepox virus]UUA44276.1 SPV0